MTGRISEEEINVILSSFYERVRDDGQLGPVFAVVEDWDEHITRLCEFWSSVMLTTGRYKGDPLSMHMVHAEKIRPEMFARWLELWRTTTEELVAPPIAEEMQARARRIAMRFSSVICGDGVVENSVGQPALPSPYRTSSLFTEATLPRALLGDHSLRSGTWGVVRVEEGAVIYRENGVVEARTLAPGTPGLIPPETPHKLELSGPVKLRVEFYDRCPVAKHS